MRCQLRPAVLMDAVDITLYQPLGNGRARVWQPAAADADWGGGWVDVDPSLADPPISFRIPVDALEALVDEAASIAKPSQATVDHLADVRAVRDRLLTVVEAQAIDRLKPLAAAHASGSGDAS